MLSQVKNCQVYPEICRGFGFACGADQPCQGGLVSNQVELSFVSGNRLASIGADLDRVWDAE
jgi:hypothetical protein